MFTLQFETDNGAFHPQPQHEIIRILTTVIERLEQGIPCSPVRDYNGHRVGSFSLTFDCEHEVGDEVFVRDDVYEEWQPGIFAGFDPAGNPTIFSETSEREAYSFCKAHEN